MEAESRPNDWLLGYQYHYVCGHKDFVRKVRKGSAYRLAKVLGTERYCDVCNDARRVVRVILFDIDSNKWL